MPTCLVDKEDGVGARCDHPGDFREVQVHRLGIAGGQDQGRTLSLSRADGAEDVGRGSTLITGRTWASATLRPATGDLVLLTDTRFILEPNLYCSNVDRLFARDFIQARREVFLKSSITPSACAWWRGRAESLR
jgi:hypothetical protein